MWSAWTDLYVSPKCSVQYFWAPLSIPVRYSIFGAASESPCFPYLTRLVGRPGSRVGARFATSRQARRRRAGRRRSDGLQRQEKTRSTMRDQGFPEGKSRHRRGRSDGNRMAHGAGEVVCGLNRIGEGAAGMRAHAARPARCARRRRARDRAACVAPSGMEERTGSGGRRRARCTATAATSRDARADERRTRGARRATRGASRHGRTRTREDQCLSSTFFGFGGDGTFAYWNAGVAFSASFVAPGR